MDGNLTEMMSRLVFSADYQHKLYLYLSLPTTYKEKEEKTLAEVHITGWQQFFSKNIFFNMERETQTFFYILKKHAKNMKKYF